MFNRLGDAVKDAAETLRRVFQAPPARGVELPFPRRSRGPFRELATRIRPGLEELRACLGTQPLHPGASLVLAEISFSAELRQESAWEAWTSKARVAAMPVFRSEKTAHLEIPPLPARPGVAPIPVPRFSTRVRAGMASLGTPGHRVLDPRLERPRTRPGIDLVLGLPVAVEGEDLRNAPRTLQMRFALQMVKATGENVRNLELLGRYLIPQKGVRELRHDARTGRLLLWLEAGAVASDKAHLLIARRKDDQGLLTCFSEEG